jgi:hypothetical protein
MVMDDKTEPEQKSAQSDSEYSDPQTDTAWAALPEPAHCAMGSSLALLVTRINV